jgi:hypothetical protein
MTINRPEQFSRPCALDVAMALRLVAAGNKVAAIGRKFVGGTCNDTRVQTQKT